MDDEDYQENWAVYLSSIGENQVGSILVDLGFANIAPIEDKPILTKFITFMDKPQEDGLSSNEESDTLNQIEDFFIDLITKDFDSVYVGRLKYAGKILSCFYSGKNNEYESVFAKLNQRFPDYRFDYNEKEEKDWQAYFELLYPSPFEMQVIQNGFVIQNLEKHGDKLEKERQVDHWIYFKTETDRKNFLEEIKNEGFEIVDEEITSSGDSPYSLQLARIDKVDYESVNEYVLYLWEKAQEFNGDYDGWETFIIKD